MAAVTPAAGAEEVLSAEDEIDFEEEPSLTTRERDGSRFPSRGAGHPVPADPTLCPVPGVQSVRFRGTARRAVPQNGLRRGSHHADCPRRLLRAHSTPLVATGSPPLAEMTLREPGAVPANVLAVAPAGTITPSPPLSGDVSGEKGLLHRGGARGASPRTQYASTPSCASARPPTPSRRVVAAGVPRVALREPAQAFAHALDWPILLDGFHHVTAAARLKPTRGA